MGEAAGVTTKLCTFKVVSPCRASRCWKANCKPDLGDNDRQRKAERGSGQPRARRRAEESRGGDGGQGHRGEDELNWVQQVEIVPPDHPASTAEEEEGKTKPEEEEAQAAAPPAGVFVGSSPIPEQSIAGHDDPDDEERGLDPVQDGESRDDARWPRRFHEEAAEGGAVQREHIAEHGEKGAVGGKAAVESEAGEIPTVLEVVGELVGDVRRVEEEEGPRADRDVHNPNGRPKSHERDDRHGGEPGGGQMELGQDGEQCQHGDDGPGVLLCDHGEERSHEEDGEQREEPGVPDQSRAEDRQGKHGEEGRGVRSGRNAEVLSGEAVEDPGRHDIAERDEGDSDEGIAGEEERDRQQIVVEGTEIGAGPADTRAQQRERVPGGDAGRDGNVSRLIQEEPGQVEPIEAREGRDAEDAGKNEPFASGGVGGARGSVRRGNRDVSQDHRGRPAYRSTSRARARRP